ncbi:DUF6894 family protein [Enterovirga aerilata]|uniref:DUF6894 family protein n=1 Tax=Enterovirga aerilata TaxID=2730920 RepID=UPI003D2E741E
MPKFYFHTPDLRDATGVELDRVELARREAFRTFGELLRDLSRVDPIPDDWHMRVTDEDDREVVRLTLSVSGASQAPSHSRLS